MAPSGEADSNETRVPIGAALTGVSIYPLEDGATPLEAFVLVKYRDGDGDETWAYRTTESPNREELLGSLMVQVAVLRAELTRDWQS